MMRIGVLFFFAPFAAMEVFFYHQFGLVLVVSLYLALSLQADFSAGRFLAQSLACARVPWNQTEPPPAEPARALPPPRVHARARPARRAEAAPATPNFSGQPHEILAVPENAGTRTIVNAFRHWIKQFHPDLAAGVGTELANARARKITEAKRLLLERRRAKRAA